MDLLDTKICTQVLGWVVKRGATWGGGSKGVKSGQNQVLMEVGEKVKEIRNIDFTAIKASNMIIHTKKLD